MTLFSLIQVPPPIVTGGDGRSRTVVYRAYPFLADWLHQAIGRQPWEVQEQRVSFYNPVAGQTVVINPNGHCDFTDGQHSTQAGRAADNGRCSAVSRCGSSRARASTLAPPTGPAIQPNKGRLSWVAWVKGAGAS